MKTLKTLIVAAAALAAVSCSQGWGWKEKSLINAASPTMRVLTINDPKDSLVLRSVSTDLTPEMIASKTYQKLADAMIATVTSPDQDGVGIAGPQVGILRNIVAVQRMDKLDQPFEVYPNIRIVDRRGPQIAGSEGCLSVPGRKGLVRRNHTITISYTNPATLKDTTEKVIGYTAVIFQHEVDHLSGVLYIDKVPQLPEKGDIKKRLQLPVTGAKENIE